MDRASSRSDALTRLQAVIPANLGLSVDACLRASSDSAVFTGFLSGQPVVVKRFPEDGARRVARMKAELDEVSGRMKGTDHGLNRCISVLPDIGAIIVEHAGNRRLSDALAQAGPERPALMARAGDWLATYVGDRRREERFRARHWRDRLEDQRPEAVIPDRVALLSRVRRRLQRMAGELAGKAFTRAATHGDYVSINALYTDGRIIGVDVQGEAWLPLAQDVAQFLVWQQMTDPAPGAQRLGISRADLDAFLSAPLLNDEERDQILPFFIGLGFLRRLADFAEDPAARKRGLGAVRHWLEDTAHMK